MTTKPFLKWAGGKTSLLPEILPLIPEFDSYCEPFLGGGSVYSALDLTGKRVILADSNKELINCWSVVKYHVEDLIEDLQTHKNDRDYYYELRSLDRSEDFDNLPKIKRASRFIFLNKTCYNGLWRVNSKGQMNTPFGKYENPNWCNKDLLRKISDKLRRENATLIWGNYQLSLNRITQLENTFVYLDPPYDPLSKTSNFTGYTNNRFDEYQQKQLCRYVGNLSICGVKFLMSNSNTELISDWYSDFTIQVVKCKRSVNCDASKRGKVNELLIKNYEV